MRRFGLVLLLVAALMPLALVACATTDTTVGPAVEEAGVVDEPAIDPVAEAVTDTAGAGNGNELGDAIVTLLGFSGLSFLLKKIVERLIKWFDFLQGDLITVAAVLVGWLLAFLFSIDPSTAIAEAVGRPLINLPDVALYLIAGFLLAIAAGYLADREELKYGSISGAQSILDA